MNDVMLIIAGLLAIPFGVAAIIAGMRPVIPTWARPYFYRLVNGDRHSDEERLNIVLAGVGFIAWGVIVLWMSFRR
jgi:hypothetical protein